MLGQKKVKGFDDDVIKQRIIDATEQIEYCESCIDPDEKLYLFTWSPDPKDMPDADLYLQHNVNISTLSDYLKCCSAGVFCVEATQLGNPHYHGWYQINNDYELVRIAIMKTLQRFGNVKLTPGHKYKIFNWKERGNCLYYYKKDICTYYSMLPNPITKDSVSTVNFDILDMVGFFKGDKAMHKVKDVLSNVQFYRQFYEDTLFTLK